MLVYGANDGKLIRALEGKVRLVASITPRRDGSVFVTTGGDGVLILWSPNVGVGLVARVAAEFAVGGH